MFRFVTGIVGFNSETVDLQVRTALRREKWDRKLEGGQEVRRKPERTVAWTLYHVRYSFGQARAGPDTGQQWAARHLQCAAAAHISQANAASPAPRSTRRCFESCFESASILSACATEAAGEPPVARGPAAAPEAAAKPPTTTVGLYHLKPTAIANSHECTYRRPAPGAARRVIQVGDRCIRGHALR